MVHTLRRAARRPDLVPPAYIEELTRLQDRTEAVPYEEVRRRLEEVLRDLPGLLRSWLENAAP